MLAHDRLKLRVVEDKTVEAGERHRLSIRDLQNGVPSRSWAVQPSGAWRPPADDRAISEAGHVV